MEAAQDSRLRGLLEAGAQFQGAAAGAAIGTIGGPPGIVLGAAAGIVVERVGREVAERVLSRRQAQRVGKVLLDIEADARARNGAGERPREDGFFDVHDDGRRPDAEELLEGILLRAANAYEERKVPLLANLYGGIAHDESIAPDDAQFLVRTVDDLTYRQLVALGVFANHDAHFEALIHAFTLTQEGRAETDPATLFELDDLGDRRLVGVLSQGVVRAVGEIIDTLAPLHAAKSGYGAFRLTQIGAELARAAGLAHIDMHERAAWVSKLARELPE